ncbi:MAG: DUF2079 domain-containing protein [Patescibacteria group bacterium]
MAIFINGSFFPMIIRGGSDFTLWISDVGLLAWLAYFFEARKRKLFWGTLAVMLLTQENMGIALASLGCIYFFQKQYRKKALLFILGGIVASLIMVGIVSLLSPVGYQYQPKVAHDPLSIATQFFDTHEKRLVWLYSFSSFAFLPLLSPGSIFAVTLDLSQYFAAASEFGHMLTPYLHHRAILAVFLSLGTLDALVFLRKKKIDLLFPVGVLVLTAIVLQYVFHFPLNKLVKQGYWQRASWMEDTDSLFKEIPTDASIATTQNLVPHLTHRKEIYLLWPRQKSGKEAQEKCGENTCWWLDFSGKPQYLIITVDDRQWVTQLLESPQNIRSALTNMEKAGKIQLIQEIDTARMYTIVY